MNWGVAVVLSLCAALAPAAADPAFWQDLGLSSVSSVSSALGRVDPAVLVGVVSFPLMEFVWRDGLRPRLIWNGFGITIVRSFRMRTIRWEEVERITEGDDGVVKRIKIDTSNGEVTWGFDHFWLAAALSKRYAARAGKNGARLAEALTWWRNNATSADTSPPNIPRRPILLYSLPFASAIIAAVIFQS